MSEDASEGGDAPAPLPDILRDPETGLPNRTFFDAVFGTVFHIGKRGLPLSIVVCRLPGAADAGREALASLGGRLREVTRQSDLRARMGREEVVLVLVDCNVHGARIVGERVVEDLSEWAAPHGLTVRAGVATHTEEMEAPADLLGRARQVIDRGVEPLEVA